MQRWFVYVALCADGSLYTGIARDVAARIAAHSAGRGARYTRGRGPVSLLAKRRCASKGDALRIEYALKGLSRDTKLAVVRTPRAFGRLAAMAAKKRAKKSANKTAKTLPKTSPLKGMPVADWVQSKTTGWQRGIVTKLLDLAKRVAPGASVSIKWGQPVLDQGGPMAFIKVAKAHVTFGFWRGAQLADPAGVLEGGDRMKHVKITSPDALDERALSAFVREAAALNRKHGDPTQRG